LLNLLINKFIKLYLLNFLGIEVIRRHCAEYIQRRDGIPSDWQNIILSAGASGSIKAILALLRCPVDGKRPGVMVPIPQYPLYSATIAEFDMAQIGYYLDESNKWGLDINELQRSIDEAKKTSAVRAIVIINPGNPTGQVLSRDNIVEIIKFAHKEKLFIFADEVYQDNIYASGSKFFSFKQVLTEMGEPYNKMDMASFMSCSKGYMGECGIRGGYAEVINMCPEVKAALLKSISAQLCPTTVGQACIDCVVNPPKQGEPSYDLFMKEKNGVLQSLKERAEMVANTFNSIEGFSCNPVQGAMYAFPQFTLPQKAIDAAKKAGQTPDSFYAFQLLESTGICIVPGAGFGQRPGTYHFRTTILPQPEKLKEMLDLFRDFHVKFLAQYK
jgi:alanine transaminase